MILVEPAKNSRQFNGAARASSPAFAAENPRGEIFRCRSFARSGSCRKRGDRGDSGYLVDIMRLKSAIFCEHAAIMVLKSLNVAVFHVKHARGPQQLGDFWLQRRDPELRWDLPHESHQAHEVLTVQFCGRVIQ